jgi:hypothetical protein
MIVLGIVRIASGDGAKISELPLWNMSGFGGAYASIIYAGMSHHSLPSIVSPIRDKARVMSLLGADYASVTVAYLVLAYSAVFAYGNVTADKCASHPGPPCKLQPLYTFNFASLHQRWLSDYLLLFPIFTLCSTFPIILITLRNNLKTLFLHVYPDSELAREVHRADAEAEARRNGGAVFDDDRHNAPPRSRRTRVRLFLMRHAFALVALSPPLVIAMFTRHVDVLVSITGAVAGMFIQFVIPAMLVHYGRRNPRLRAAYAHLIGGAEVRPLFGSASVGGRRSRTRGRKEEEYNEEAAAEAEDEEEDEVEQVLRRSDVSSSDADSGVGMVDASTRNPYISPFASQKWIWAIAVWSCSAFVIISYNLIRKVAK